MATILYEFEGQQKELDFSDGSGRKPIIVLLHGTGGTKSDMVSPGSAPDNNYDHSSIFPGDVSIGWRDYPGIGVWSCCELDPKMDVLSWREILSKYNFRTAVYSQVDPVGFLARPVAELVVVMATLQKNFPETDFVLLAHSRGGLLTRKFLKDNPELARMVTKVITLHSPHTGSSLASIASTVREIIETLQDAIGDIVLVLFDWLLDLADSDAYREMAIGSEFLTELAKGENAYKWIQYFTFGGTSVRLSRIRSWVYTAESAIPQWHLPPFFHERAVSEVPGISPIADSLPNLIDELTEGLGDLLTADARTRLPFATHQVNHINHAEALWHPLIQAQVLRILGEDPSDVFPPGDDTSFWG